MAHLTVNGEALRADAILSLTLRTDLAPIPATLEATIRYDEKVAPFLVEGKIVTAGLDNADYRILKSEPRFSKEGEQAGRPMASIAISAYLDKVHQLAFRRRTAVIKEQATLSQIYSACGATALVESDFTAYRFSCFAGGVPTYGVGAILQEEGGAIYWTGKSLKFARLLDLIKQTPATDVPANSVQQVESGFLERHEIPWFYSTDETGAFVFGNRDKVRSASYTPRKDERVLRNMTRCLILRHTLRSFYRPDINAGAVITIDGDPHVVVTAAHVLNSGTDGSPSTTFSKFWLGALDQ